MDTHVPQHIDRGLLSLYLSDHLSGATAGVDRIKRMAKRYSDTPLAPELATLVEEIEQDRQVLVEVINRLGLHRRFYRQVLAAFGEHATRLKFNRRLLTRSPMSELLELELMRGAVTAKLAGWEVLTALAPDLGLRTERFERLCHTAREQRDTLDGLHARMRASTFRTNEPVH